MDTQPQPVPATLDEVRLAVFRQHTHLSQLLDELEAHAKAALGGGAQQNAMGQALSLLEVRLSRHLDYEEAHLSRWIPPTSPLLQDHPEQRDRMRGLRHDSAVFGDPATLAREVLAFIHALRKDMTEEDAALRAL